MSSGVLPEIEFRRSNRIYSEAGCHDLDQAASPRVHLTKPQTTIEYQPWRKSIASSLFPKRARVQPIGTADSGWRGEVSRTTEVVRLNHHGPHSQLSCHPPDPRTLHRVNRHVFAIGTYDQSFTDLSAVSHPPLEVAWANWEAFRRKGASQ